ncbi:MAG: CYTH domain-containing protein [Terriglobales bacterium]
MGKEIERKFLVKDNSWRAQDTGKRYRQGYLSAVKERTVRVRTAGDKAYLTIKGITVGASRPEYEYEIPVADANEMLDQLSERPLIEKTRYRIQHDGLVWEIDEFEGENRGLITAEVELKDEHQFVALPAWVGEEVTGDPRYFNANLVAKPFTKW